LNAYAEIMLISGDDADNYVRDFSLLESALNRPKAAAYYEEADLIEQAASLLWGIARNHPFVDGNKRAAYIVMVGFLRANGWSINAATDDKYTFMIAVAEHLTSQDVAEWIRARVTPYVG
ncbi:MAG TPA: type II toxin-antitoxin system death-on-curing family toxin, partial [Nitrolancea sp.]|nr:type II toxin-antitoxin system death-on-curing family toxin [Nitrolancea sp.]